MFTGLIEKVGTVVRFEHVGSQGRLVLDAPLPRRRVKVGDSISVNGCCLTIVKCEPRTQGVRLHFDLLQETIERTNLSSLQTGSGVNLETSMNTMGGFHGHFVTGHVEGLGTIARWDNNSGDWTMEVRLPKQLRSYVVHKGSIAIDGISLTIAKLTSKSLAVNIIPHTLEATNLPERKIGDEVNIETDVLAKYVEAILNRRLKS